jgi:hypothetical protein
MSRGTKTYFMIISILLILITIALVVLEFIAWWKIYVKAGKPGWAFIVPIYGTLVLLEIVGKPWWWLLLFLIPGLNLIWIIWMINLLSKSFGKDVGFTLGLIFLGPIFILILGFGSAKYVGAAGK